MKKEKQNQQEDMLRYLALMQLKKDMEESGKSTGLLDAEKMVLTYYTCSSTSSWTINNARDEMLERIPPLFAVKTKKEGGYWGPGFQWRITITVKEEKKAEVLRYLALMQLRQDIKKQCGESTRLDAKKMALTYYTSSANSSKVRDDNRDEILERIPPFFSVETKLSYNCGYWIITIR